MARRNRTSTIDQLPKPVRAKIAQLRDKGRTIDEILAVLETLLNDAQVPSRSALGRHLKKQEQVTARIRQSRQMVEAIAKSFGDKQTSDIARMNMELMHDIILRVLMITDDEGNAALVDPKDIMFLATAMEKNTKASKADFDQQLAAAREMERRLATEDAAEQAAATAKKKGLSSDTINAIKASILGVEHG
jgi:hypothetical protein